MNLKVLLPIGTAGLAGLVRGRPDDPADDGGAPPRRELKRNEDTPDVVMLDDDDDDDTNARHRAAAGHRQQRRRATDRAAVTGQRDRDNSRGDKSRKDWTKDGPGDRTIDRRATRPTTGRATTPAADQEVTVRAIELPPREDSWQLVKGDSSPPS